MRRRGFQGIQRSKAITPMTMATTSSAPRIYLLDANHDSDCSDELKNGAELSELSDLEEFATVSGSTAEAEAAALSGAVAAATGAEVEF